LSAEALNVHQPTVSHVGFAACTPHIPPKSNRYDGITYSKTKYKKRNLIERCFNKLKQFRHIATRYDRSALNYLAMLKIACLRLWLGFYESAA
jgi:hypothetical protein